MGFENLSKRINLGLKIWQQRIDLAPYSYINIHHYLCTKGTQVPCTSKSQGTALPKSKVQECICQSVKEHKPQLKHKNKQIDKSADRFSLIFIHCGYLRTKQTPISCTSKPPGMAPCFYALCMPKSEVQEYQISDQVNK